MLARERNVKKMVYYLMHYVLASVFLQTFMLP